MIFFPIVPLLFLTSAMAHPQSADSPTPSDKAGIYAARQVPPMRALLSALAPTARISEGYDGETTNFTCTWPGVSVRFTIKHPWNVSVQRLAMKKWISGFRAPDRSTPAVETLLRKIDATVDCVGSVCIPRYDRAGKASALVLGVAAKLEGYVYSKGTFYDATGARIIGDLKAPPKLQHEK